MALPSSHFTNVSIGTAGGGGGGGGAGGRLSSPRNSPFRRPESPVSPSPLRKCTSKAGQVNNNSRFTSSTSSASSASSTPAVSSIDVITPRVKMPLPQQFADDVFGSSGTLKNTFVKPATMPADVMGRGDALSQLQPAQVQTLREGFEILDRDSDGVVHREDVADMLKQLGLPSTATDVALFFPPAVPQTTTLAAFLNTIGTTLASLSPSAELLSALSAFDDDDSGQVDLAELRDALLHTAPEPGEKALTSAEIDQVLAGFSGKRAFGGKGRTVGGFGKRGEVFRYHDFIASIAGGRNGNLQVSNEDEEAGKHL